MDSPSEIQSSDPADEAFLRAMTFPEEERANWTTSPWRANSVGFGRRMSLRSRSGGKPTVKPDSAGFVS